MNLTESFKEDNGMMLYFVKKSSGPPKKDMEDAYNTAIESMGVDNLIKWIEKDEECLSIPKAKLSRSVAVFVFEDFVGAGFEYISSSSDSLILGPRCVLASYLGNITIPKKFGCVMNLALRNLCITGSGMGVADKQALKKLINYMGGDYSEQLTEHCTHLVTITVKSMKYLEAGKLKMHIMHKDWIHDVWQKSRSENVNATAKEYDKYKLPVFYNLNVTSSGLTPMDRNNVKLLIDANGGKYDGSFKSEIVDILIVDKNKTDSIKFKAAVKYKKECLTVSWVMDSIEQGYALNTKCSKYQVVGIKVSTPNKIDKSVNAADFHGDMTNICNISRISNISNITSATSSRCDINETNRSSIGVLQPKYKLQMAKLNVSDAKRAGLFLDGCNIYLSGFTSEENNLLNKILNSGGATRFDEINDQVSHVLVGQRIESDLNVIQQDNLEAAMITVDWLIASIKMKHIAPIDSFLVSNVEKTIPTDQSASPASKKTIKSMNNTFKRPQTPKLNLDATSTTAAGPSGLYRQSNAENVLLEQYLEDNEMDEIKPTPVQLPPRAKAKVNLDFQSNQSTRAKNPMLTEQQTDCSVDLNFLERKIIFLYGFDNNDDYHQIIKDCISFGANIVDAKYERTVDYCIAPSSGCVTLKVPVRYKHFVTNLWLEASMLTNSCVDVEYFHKPFLRLAHEEKFLHNETLVVSNYKNAERFYIFALGTAMGGNISDVLKKVDTPILITPQPEGAKYSAAISWKVPVLTVEWLVECYKQKKRVDERDFLVGDSIVSSKNIEKCNSPVSRDSSLISPPQLERSSKRISSQPRNSILNDGSSDEESPAPFQIVSESPIVRPKRVAELNPHRENGSPMCGNFASPRVVSAPASPVTPPYNFERSHNISALTKDMPTPQRQITYNALKDAYNSESSQAKRLKVLCGTPLNEATNNFKNSPMPVMPECVQTPKENLSFWPDASPGNQIYHKRKLEVLDMYHIPVSDSIKQKYTQKPIPSYEQRRKSMWKDLLGDEYDSPCTQTNTQALLRREPQNGDDYESVPKSLNFEEENIEVSKNSPNVQKLSDFLKKRNEEKELQNKMHMFQKPSQLEHHSMDTEILSNNANQYDSDGLMSEDIVVGWRDPSDEQDSKRFKPQSRMKEQNPIFLISSIDIEDKDKINSNIERLRGKVYKKSGMFHKTCTHLITDKPNRAEKFLSAVASGRFVLHSDYITECLRMGYFIDEEMFEWGNPANDYKYSDPIYKAPYMWRMKIKNEPDFKNGVFSGFHVLLRLREDKLTAAISNIIKCGGGTIVEIHRNPVNSSLLRKFKTTHCLTDKNVLNSIEVAEFNSLKIPLLAAMYLNAFLLNELSAATAIKDHLIIP